jgi:hypothetical protein
MRANALSRRPPSRYDKNYETINNSNNNLRLGTNGGVAGAATSSTSTALYATGVLEDILTVQSIVAALIAGGTLVYSLQYTKENNALLNSELTIEDTISQQRMEATLQDRTMNVRCL